MITGTTHHEGYHREFLHLPVAYICPNRPIAVRLLEKFHPSLRHQTSWLWVVFESTIEGRFKRTHTQVFEE